MANNHPTSPYPSAAGIAAATGRGSPGAPPPGSAGPTPLSRQQQRRSPNGSIAGFARAEVSLLKKIEAKSKEHPDCLGLKHFSVELYGAIPTLKGKAEFLQCIRSGVDAPDESMTGCCAVRAADYIQFRSVYMHTLYIYMLSFGRVLRSIRSPASFSLHSTAL